MNEDLMQGFNNNPAAYAYVSQLKIIHIILK